MFGYKRHDLPAKLISGDVTSVLIRGDQSELFTTIPVYLLTRFRAIR
ncbi:hypothetical protein BZB76_1233 [Actinomadura pelletieri DSM 43383]|uniref:Uncharacterized protein n=1 Tax=Actinomadura pelletieri DSM 43383 TaxID=1120940 RepID=A0A495R0L1_9ACTN|nr:hypothetical protein BZB76_1233 [Actinomadura pelletieri DSM 43383]